MADTASNPMADRRATLVTAILVQGAVLAAVLAYYYWHVLYRLTWIWRNNSDWSHGFIIPIFSLYYLYLQRDRLPIGLPTYRIASRIAGAGLLLVAFVMYYQATLSGMGYPKDISVVISIMGVVLMACGWPCARWAWFAVAFLIFALKLPDRLYEQMTMPLREVAAWVSTLLLNLVPDMMAQQAGALVEWVYGNRSGTLDVERACSGMRLLMTMTALGVAMAFIHERPLWQRFVMILACIPIAIFCNIIRVTVTGFMVVFGQGDLAKGTPHMLLGMGMLVVAFMLYSGLAYVLNHLVIDQDADSEENETLSEGTTV